MAIIPFLLAATVSLAPSAIGAHVWEKQELTFTAARAFTNAYTEAVVWVDLTGPGFTKRVYGFWDGGQTFRVRLLATAPGTWTWRSGSSPADDGLAGKSGSFEAMAWSEAEKQANPLRRGLLRPTANHHALEHADGTPFFVLGDTWWPLGANRFRWCDDDQERPIGPTAGFKDYARCRKAQGFNWINMIAAFPNWMTDEQPWHVVMNDPPRTTVRSAWLEFGANSAKNMDNEGGRPFLFPGKVPGYENMFPDVDRVNPAYFRYVDRKVDYLNEQGFVPFKTISSLPDVELIAVVHADIGIRRPDQHAIDAAEPVPQIVEVAVHRVAVRRRVIEEPLVRHHQRLNETAPRPLERRLGIGIRNIAAFGVEGRPRLLAQGAHPGHPGREILRLFRPGQEFLGRACG